MKNVKLFAFADEASPNVDGQIDAMVRNGLHGLEIRGVDGLNVSKITVEKAKEVRNKLDDEGLATWSVGSPIGKIGMVDDFEAHKDVFRHTLEVADILGAKQIRLFSFYIPENENADTCEEQVIDRLGQLLTLAAGSGATLCHQNETGTLGDTAARWLRVHQQLPPLIAVFDPANFVQSGVDTLRAWEVLNPYVYYMHVKDACPDGKVVPAGCGAGNVKEIARRYLLSGGSVFTMEPHLKVFDGLAELERPGETASVPAFAYPTADAAFDAACAAFKTILEEL